MKTSIHTVCYVSTAISTITNDNVNEVFDGIVEKNLSLGITGVLLFSHENFMQVMEGPPHNLLPLYETIKRDQRHHHIIEILNQSTSERMFENYQTGFSIVDNSDQIFSLQKYLRFIEDNFDGAVKKRAEVVRPFIY
ncbi:hypothetical protein BTO09_03045 [Gilvibacter sp. SZ-19]|uniref:BLUF domain-containing protein n=1 Tax=Gilvibacter sp. SZ-19 TaxID=754429 RepID=UPI000B3BFA63|nr:BLUF domain-containing protein [Gilvibacter sp. SZ-19]ARV11378.1 hypothetical protein BTO09_03045 [Gilvibacter sp. SZ-19]